MKKLALVVAILFIFGASFAQTKPAAKPVAKPAVARTRHAVVTKAKHVVAKPVAKPVTK